MRISLTLSLLLAASTALAAPSIKAPPTARWDRNCHSKPRARETGTTS